MMHQLIVIINDTIQLLPPTLTQNSAKLVPFSMITTMQTPSPFGINPVPKPYLQFYQL